MQTLFPRASALGFACGAILYGLPVALLHVLHNRLGSVRDALVLALVCALLYGLMAGIPTVLVAAALSARRWLRGRRLPRERLETDWGLRLGLVAFTVMFWEAALLYGLTYEQTLIVRPAGFVGMALYLAVAAFLIAIAAGMVAVVVERFLSRAPTGAVAAALLGLPVLLLAGAVAAAIASAPSSIEFTPAANARSPIEPAGSGAVVLVAFDGLDRQVVDRLVAEGELPAFEAARREGVWGEMETIHDSNSAVIWATMYTGKRPREHGILDFYRIRLPGVGAGLFPVHRTFFKELVGILEGFGLASRVAVTRADLGVVPLWEIADHYGITIGVADGYLYSFPAYEPETAGSWFLSYTLDSFARLLRESEAEPEDAPLFVQPIELLGAPFGGGRLPRDEDCEWQAKATLELLAARARPRLLSVYCHQPDTVQHEAWSELEPARYPPWRRPAEWAADARGAPADGGGGGRGRDGGADPITLRHRQLDAFLGALRARLDPEVAVLVLSDHGHAPTFVHKLESQHRHGPPGAFLAFGGPFRRGVDLGAGVAAEGGARSVPHVLDVAPTVLHLLGLPVAEDMPGRVLDELFAPSLEPAVRTIDTYEGRWQPRIRDVSRDRRMNELEIEKLRKLGYVL